MGKNDNSPGNQSSAGLGGSDGRSSPSNSDSSYQDVGNSTFPDPGPYTSLELLHPLIQFLSQDFNSSKRLAYSSLTTVSQSKKLYKGIYDLIIKVDQSPTADWTSYEKYSTAIEPLEDLLFNFAVEADSDARNLSKKKLIEDLKASKGTIFDPTDCVAVVSAWEADRSLITTFLNNLKDNAKLKAIIQVSETEIKTALKHDDETLLAALGVNIQGQMPSGFPKASIAGFNTVKNGMKTVETEFKNNSSLSLDSSAKCVASVMLINEALEALKATASSTEAANKEWNAHLKTAPVWEAAKTLLTTVYNHIKNPTQTTLPKLDADYAAFLKALFSGDCALPPSLFDLIKKAAKVKRPFYLQSLVLVSICKVLADDFQAGKEKKADRFLPLDETLAAGVAALDKAAAAIQNLANLDENGHKQQSDDIFKDVNDKLSECLKVYKKQALEQTYKTDLQGAFSRDKVALERIQKKLKNERPFNRVGS